MSTVEAISFSDIVAIESSFCSINDDRCCFKLSPISARSLLSQTGGCCFPLWAPYLPADSQLVSGTRRDCWLEKGLIAVLRVARSVEVCCYFVFLLF